MPNTKSGKKRSRQALERRGRNRARKSELKTRVRAVREAAKSGDPAKADAEFKDLTKRLDQAAAKGTVHKNLAARVKSRVSAYLKTAKKTAKK